MEDQGKLNFRQTLSTLLRSNRRHVHYVQILACLALIVAVAVPLSMRQHGVAKTTTETHLSCHYSGSGAHTHNDDCYDAEGNLVCPLEERELHVHDDSCYTEHRDLICGMQEGEGAHTHSDACYNEDGKLMCGLEESEGHVHTDECYETTRELTCSLEEVTEEHVHGPACFETVQVPTPAQELTGTLKVKDENGNEYVTLVAQVKAAEGVLPKGATMTVQHVNLDETDPQTAMTVRERFEAALLAEAGDTATFAQIDAVGIKFHDAQGNLVDPDGKVEVRISTATVRTFSDQRTAGDEAANNSELLVLSAPDAQHGNAASAEIIRGLALVNQDANDASTGHEDTVLFEASGPSVYAVARVDYTVPEAEAEAMPVEPAVEVQPTVIETEAQQSEPKADNQPTEPEQEATPEATSDAAPEATPEAASQASDPTHPAQSFTHRFTSSSGKSLLRVDVAAPEGAFPAGTTMKVTWMDTSDVEGAVTEAVAERTDGKLLGMCAVDITFLDSEGREIEPAKKITVTFASDFIDTADDSYVVHLDDDGKGEVIDALGSKELESREIADQADELVFESDAFSTYVVALTTLRKELAASDGKTYDISVDAPAEAGIPQDAELRVVEVAPGTAGYEDYLAQALQALGEGATADNTTLARFFDIKIMSGGQEVQPQAPVTVSVQLADAEAKGATASAVHFGSATEAAPEVLDVTQDGDVATFDATGFSVYGVIYTVDFHWEVDGQTYDYSIKGGDTQSLRELLVALKVVEATEAEAFVAQVADVKFSDPELVAVAKVEKGTTAGELKEKLGVTTQYSAQLKASERAEMDAKELKAGDWALVSLKAFDTTETLTITMANGDVLTIKVTDAQLYANILTADGELWHITITYDDSAKIPDGSVLVAKEIAEGTKEYEKYLEKTADQWEAADKDGFINLVRFFDIEIQKDGKKVEPEAPVEVDIEHEDGFTLGNDESLSVIHFAESGTEIIDELHRNENGTEVIYEQGSFSVIGTVSTVKDSGWPTANGQYVLVLQDGDDYYALKQDGTLQKVRFFNNTVSFIGEGTTTTGYINDYLWYVVSSGNRGKISDEYTEYNATPTGQTFIDLNNANILSGTSRQLFISDGKIYCGGQLPGSSSYTQVALSASDGQLSRVALTSSSASPVFFASASTFTANENETDLFTQEEVESIIDKWKEQKTQKATYDKTAEVYDYENRIYQVDITASSSDYEVSPSIALEFVVDASRSMFFPTSVTGVGTFTGTDASGVRNWINEHGNTDQVYFVIQNKNGAATQFAIFYDPNSEYQVNEPYYYYGWHDNYVTYRGQWLWVDASVYNPPDDVANGGSKNTRQSGLPLSSWNYGNLDDGKIYTTDITDTSTGTYGERKVWISRIEYLKQCVRVAAQVIYAVDDNAQIGLIGFNKNTTDYGTYGKDEQQELLNQLNGVSLDGGTNHQGGLQKAIDKYKDSTFYAEHYAGRKHVVVLVTDGAPNASGVTWTTIGDTATTLKNLKDDFDDNTELYTMGLSLSNVGSNQSNLFGISSGAGYTYAGEDAAQIINAVTKMVDGIFVQANLVADVKDVIDPAFYPVDRADGSPLAENDWINLSGTKVNAGDSGAAGQIKKDSSTGNWYVEWKNQSIDWPTLDAHGAVEEPGWHGTVFVKAKEDFLGGNGISTNAEGSQLEAKQYKVRGESELHNLPEGDHTTPFETPYVNIDELDITENDTEWTVYLGTNVDPLAEVKALWKQVKVKEVVTKTDEDHRMSSDGQLTYSYTRNAQDNRSEANSREEFPITDLGITLTDDDWADLIAGNYKDFAYSAYDHTSVGNIRVSLTQAVVTGEDNLSESPHATTVVGNEVEKYTLTVSYRPANANISNWHTGSYGTGVAGNRSGNISKDNTHTINVYVKGLQITKVNLDDNVLLGAKFALYRTARTGETETMEINGTQYCKVAELDTSATGIAIKERIEQLESDEQYYLVETQVPDGYNAIAPIPVNLNMSDAYTPKPEGSAQTTKPASGIYDWTQSASLTLEAGSGVKQTNADNTEDLTHTGAAAANTTTEIVYYRITNNPGVELPHTGGVGTYVHTLCGLVLFVAAGFVGITSRRKESREAA